MTNEEKRALKAQRSLEKASREFHEAIAAAFPEGREIQWVMRHHYITRGVVIMVSGDRLKVRADSGKEYWIYVYRALEALA